MFTAAAEVFGRLSIRFPSHKLAEKTTVLSGQCYMRAQNYKKAITALTEVIEKKDADKDVRAEAMYWCGDCYTKIKAASSSAAAPMVSAYRMFKRVTWDYPTTKWAKYARARLTESEIATAGSE
jgi:outer membrane protein assembly factor BamD (BamD/ComL family)